MAYRILLAHYYRKCLANADAVIYAVGMFKFATQNLSFYFSMINREATRRGIPVMISAASVAEPDLSDERCHQLIACANEPSVAYITTRDGEEGVRLLKSDYVRREGIECAPVGDPGLWIPEVYSVSAPRTSGIIGVNLPRFGLYRDYNGTVSDERLMSFYVELLHELTTRKENWVLFCNGMDADRRFGEALLARGNFSSERMLPVARNAEELVRQISGFSVVFAARLHACIVSHALGIPVIGLLWDNKLKYFQETMGLNWNFLTHLELDPKTVAVRLGHLKNVAINPLRRDECKLQTAESIAHFLRIVQDSSSCRHT